MKVRSVFIIICIFFCSKYARSSESIYAVPSSEINHHEIRLSVSDATPLTVANFLGTGIGDALTGTQRANAESWGLLGIGYRYSLSKWKVGGDFGFGYMTSDIISSSSYFPDINQADLNFLIMPAGEMSYYQKRYINLYGSVSLGLMLTRTNYTAIINNQNKAISDSDYISKFYSTFAFQVNPIAIRVGNERIGGFLELGVGFKGFLIAGISIQF